MRRLPDYLQSTCFRFTPSWSQAWWHWAKDFDTSTTPGRSWWTGKFEPRRSKPGDSETKSPRLATGRWRLAQSQSLAGPGCAFRSCTHTPPRPADSGVILPIKWQRRMMTRVKETRSHRLSSLVSSTQQGHAKVEAVHISNASPLLWPRQPAACNANKRKRPWNWKGSWGI